MVAAKQMQGDTPRYGSASAWPDAPPPGCAIVMAHPDDEVLWASSVLAKAGPVILCYGDFPGRIAFSKGRRAAVAALPLAQAVTLDVTEATMFNHAAWPKPVEIPEGLMPRPLPLNLHGAVLNACKANFRSLCQMLETRLAGVQDVVTHNPWGEYGHEDHVQVFRAVEHVGRRLGLRIWVTGYASDKTVLLMQRHLHRLGAATQPLPTDKAMGDRFRQIYIDNGCWTWPADYVWPATEWFFPLLEPDAREPTWVQPVQVNMIRFDWTDPGSLRQTVTSALRHLRYRVVTRFPAMGRLIERVRG
jgi:LmbE family N-acetylglucosaminyl deacetylase